VLLQPAELLIIEGAGAGTVLVANPLHILKKVAGGIGGVLGGSTAELGKLPNKVSLEGHTDAKP
jgi:flagellar motor component MotA